MKQRMRMRITIEVDTELSRKVFNDEALFMAAEACTIDRTGTRLGVLVYCATEVVTEKRINLLRTLPLGKRVKSS